MMNSRIKSVYRVVAALVIVLVFWISFSGEKAKSFSAGAPAGYCGTPASGNSTCFTCHNDGPPPITLPGMITSTIPVAGYTPGATYTVTATVSGPGHQRFGFEISPQDNSGNLLGSMNDLNIETMFQGAGVYITHSSSQVLTPNSKSWTFEWVAPAAGTGNVTFYGAFNISNNDGSYTGDTILVSTLTVSEDSGLAIGEVSPIVEIGMWMNGSQLNISGISTSPESIRITDLSGRVVYNTKLNPVPATGIIQIPIEKELTDGIYIISIQTENLLRSEKVLITN